MWEGGWLGSLPRGIDLQYVKLGNTELRPSRLGFGCSRIASLSNTHTPSEVRTALLEAFDQGINFFDTADVYGQGDSERLIGKLFRNRRSQVILCSKAGLTVGASQTLIRWIKPVANPIIRRWKSARHKTIGVRRKMERKCFEPAYLKEQIEGSLRRLGTDYLDLFLLHSPPSEVIVDETVFTMLQELKSAGLIRYYGVSCDSSQQALITMVRAEVSCLQVPVNLMQRKTIESVLPAARKKRIGIVAREPLAGGAVFSHPPLLDICHDNSDCSPARLAIRYSMEKADAGVILAGMSCRRHLEENLKILESPPLSAEEMARLDSAVEEGTDR